MNSYCSGYTSTTIRFPNKKSRIAHTRMMSAGGENYSMWNHYLNLNLKYSKI